MLPFLKNEPTDNIISRHFNQNLNRELFNFQTNLDEKKDLNKIKKEELELNKNEKIRDLINDCELINNNNINNFVLGIINDKEKCDHTDIKLVNENNCKCKCHCSNHKKKSSFNLLKKNKFLNTLSKLNNQKVNEKKETKEETNYNFSPFSHSNYSLSSSSSISSQAISISSSSSFQENNYSLPTINYNYSKPTRKVPIPVIKHQNKPKFPEPVTQSTLNLFIKENEKDFKTESNDYLNESDLSINLLNKSKPNIFINEREKNIFSNDNKPNNFPYQNELNNFSNQSPSKNLLNQNQLDNFVNKSQINNYSNENKLDLIDQKHDVYQDINDLSKFSDNFDEKSDQDSIYETIDNEDDIYDFIDDYEVINCNEKNDDEEDLYQDIIVDNDDDIYESLSNELNYSLSLNENSNEKNLLSQSKNLSKKELEELDKKILKKQKILDKKRLIQAEKLKKKYNISGNEIPLNVGLVKDDVKGNNLDLNINKNEIVLILRIDGNPPGKWLAKNERGKIGYVDLNIIDVDPESIKNLMKVPNCLTTE